MEDTKKTVLAGNGEKDVPRAVYDGVLTIDVDAQVESMEEQEEARWHQLLNKDDFYKEFRTEKELCEYLEEIDSRAEWIRVTSKKLKVAAAGEETCTEVPGISLEALEKDTLSHSRLVLILPERICYIGNSAIKSLKGRARIDGKALADVDKKTLAEILNKCLKVARGRALIRFCEGKIRAVLSGDEKDYVIISMPDMYMVTSAYIHGDYEKATFLNGYADHYSVTASWQLEDNAA